MLETQQNSDQINNFGVCLKYSFPSEKNNSFR